MRIVPLPPDLPIEEGQHKGTLGPPEGMESRDCDTIEVLHTTSILPSGGTEPSVMALVFVSAAELERIGRAGGHFWVGFLGTTFPPVFFMAPDPDGTPEEPE